MRRYLAFVIAALALGAPLCEAQSLGDVAKREEARRKTITSTSKVYTNDSLRPDGTSAAPAPPAAPAAKPEPDKTAETKPAAADPKKDEKYWRSRITEQRDALGRSQTFAEALQSRINALTADFANRDDPFQRNQIAGDRQKALAELDRVKKEIADHTKAITDIQEEARKAGVPAGWVR